MEYGRKLAVWGWGMMIALAFLVLFMFLSSHLQGWGLLLLVIAAIVTIRFSTSMINRRHRERLAAASTENIEY
jgi:1,4-dihydroxy-2-naphthoate octaprenyltransferase